MNKLITKGNANNSVSQATIDKWSEKCVENAQYALDALSKEDWSEKMRAANSYASNAYTACSNMGMAEADNCKRFTISCQFNKENAPKDETKCKNSESSFRSSMEVLKTSCDGYVTTDQNGKAVKAARIAVPIVTTLAGGALGAGITASVIKAKKENIRNESAQKWMDEVGEHIQCYIGVDELGSYGDVVSIELD